MEKFEKFEKAIGVNFNDENLLREAFTHRSYVNEHRGKNLRHNERLEFLGDAVLELVVTAFLFQKYPDKTEGDLTSYRAGMVNTSTLSTVATGLGMNDFLLLSKGEAKDTGRARQYILANTFESVVGALYLDQGYDAAKGFIADNIFSLADDIVSKKLWQDSKSRFQELAQEHESVTPTYELMRSEGPDHDKVFVVCAMVDGVCIAEGEGQSKQEAEQEAARAALEARGWE